MPAPTVRTSPVAGLLLITVCYHCGCCAALGCPHVRTQCNVINHVRAGLKPHFGAAKSGIIGVNCSTPLCVLDAVSITSAGYPPGIPAVRVYAGRVSGTTIIGGDSSIWSVGGVQDEAGLPTGIWKQAQQAGWAMSGPITRGNGQPTAALTFVVSGESKPRKVIRVDGSVEYARPQAEAGTVGDDEQEEEEPPTVLQVRASTVILLRINLSLDQCKMD